MLKVQPLNHIFDTQKERDEVTTREQAKKTKLNADTSKQDDKCDTINSVVAYGDVSPIPIGKMYHCK